MCGVAKVHHFPLPTQCCPVAVVYPCIPQEGEGEGELDQELLPLRLKLHHTFCLPNDRPFLRTINRHCFVRPQGKTPELLVICILLVGLFMSDTLLFLMQAPIL